MARLKLALVFSIAIGALTIADVAVAATKPTNTTLPAVTGTAQRGLTLAASTGSWSGTAPITFAYAWRRCNSSGGSCSTISGATSSTRLLVTADVGKTIRVVVTASNSAGSTAATSVQTPVVVAAVVPANTVLPVISGSVHDGQTLKSSIGTWNGSPAPTFAYQWKSCDASGGACANIAGATLPTLIVASGMAGATLRSTVTATNVAGTATAQSAAVGPVPIAPSNTSLPTVSGLAKTAQTLTAAAGTWSGVPAPTYSWQWERCNSSGSGCTVLGGATSQTYVVSGLDLGGTIRVSVIGSNSAGSAAAVSAVSAVVTEGPPMNLTPPTVTGSTTAGSVLFGTTGTWANGVTSFQFRWNLCDASLCYDAVSPCCSSAYFPIPPTWAPKWVKLKVRATNTYGFTEAFSAVTAPVSAFPALPWSSLSYLNLDSAASPPYSFRPSIPWNNGPILSEGGRWYACDSSISALSTCVDLAWAADSPTLALPVQLHDPVTGSVQDASFGVCDYYHHYTDYYGMSVTHPVDVAGKWILRDNTATNAIGQGHTISVDPKRIPIPGVDSQSSLISMGCPARSSASPDQALLDQFAPELRFDPAETYRPASAALATDTYFAGEQNHANQLEILGTKVASADPADSTDLLSLAYLSFPPIAASGMRINEADVLGDQPASSAVDYIAMLQRTPSYANKMYGRVVSDGGTGDKYLQYWFYYYFNQFGPLGQGNHEGDWESVTYRVAPSNALVEAIYSQHGSNERCGVLGGVQVSGSGHPIVWVANGSHASYFWAGTHANGFPQPDDQTASPTLFDSVVPGVISVSGPNPPAWIAWNGYWGNNNGVAAPPLELGGASPESPANQGSWDAINHMTGGSPCTTPPSPSIATRPSSRLSRPVLRGDESNPHGGVPAAPAKAVGSLRPGAVRVRYCLPDRPESSGYSPVEIMTSVDNLDDGLPALTLVRRAAPSRCGTVNTPTGVLRPPYRVRAAVLVQGRRSAWVSAPLGRG